MFQCKISGEPYPKVTWSKGRKILTTTKTKNVEVYYDETEDQHNVVLKGMKNIGYIFIERVVFDYL